MPSTLRDSSHKHARPVAAEVLARRKGLGAISNCTRSPVAVFNLELVNLTNFGIWGQGGFPIVILDTLMHTQTHTYKSIIHAEIPSSAKSQTTNLQV